MKKNDKDCRNCIHFDSCPCGKDGHKNGTFGYSIGECKDFKTTK